MNVFFRADASPHIGAGHVMRCLTLAGVLKQQGGTCRFLTAETTFDTVPAMRGDAFPVILTEDGDTAFMTAEPSCDWLVVDHYRLDAGFERACRGWARRILVIDDLADREHDCDLLLDQTFGRDAGDYVGLVPGDATLMLGAEFALLRDQFPQARAAALTRRREGGAVRRILVSLGGVAPLEVLTTVLRGLAAADTGARIDVIAGLSVPGIEHLHDLVPELKDVLSVHEGVEDMAGFMAACDLAVGAAGTTSWERCCLGLPSLLVVLADNQSVIARNLAQAEAAVSLGWWRDLTVEGVAQAVASVCADDAQRTKLSDNAARICDGEGARRVCDRMKDLS